MNEPLTDEEFGELARVHHPCFEVMLKNWHPLIAKVKSLKIELSCCKSNAEENQHWIGELSNNAGKLKEENTRLKSMIKD